MNELEQLFEEIKGKEEEKLENSKNFFNDERFINWKPGFTYRLMLVLIKTKNRTTPFINKYDHNHWDAKNLTVTMVTCPTSEYLSDVRGFKECPICPDVRGWYKERYESQSSADLYNQYSRNFNGYVIAIVLKDPTNKDNNNHLKIMRYGKTINKWFKKKIFGIDVKTKKIINNKPYLASAFIDGKNSMECYPLSVCVSETEYEDRDTGNKTSGNQYELEFEREKVKCPITKKQLVEEFKVLNFDKDFYISSTKEELLEFQKFYLNANTDQKETSVEDQLNEALENDSEEPKDEIDEIDVGQNDVNNDSSDDINDITDDIADEINEEVSKPSDDDDIDIDELLGELDN